MENDVWFLTFFLCVCLFAARVTDRGDGKLVFVFSSVFSTMSQKELTLLTTSLLLLETTRLR